MLYSLIQLFLNISMPPSVQKIFGADIEMISMFYSCTECTSVMNFGLQRLAIN
jgi:hypothetical protein